MRRRGLPHESFSGLQSLRSRILRGRVLSALREVSREGEEMSGKLQMYEGLGSCQVVLANEWSLFPFFFFFSAHGLVGL
jgi:hypothetical protein